MNAKVVVGVLVILVGIILGTINFLNTKVNGYEIVRQHSMLRRYCLHSI
jgi:hypothetical protein